jgi:hypothetical protein
MLVLFPRDMVLIRNNSSFEVAYFPVFCKIVMVL